MQTVSGMHDCGIAWVDSKPDNLVCSSSTGGDPKLTAIAAGFCCRIPAGKVLQPLLCVTLGPLQIVQDQHFSSIALAVASHVLSGLQTVELYTRL